MSMESAQSFIAKMKTDEDFARQVRECEDAGSRMVHKYTVDNGNITLKGLGFGVGFRF